MVKAPQHAEDLDAPGDVTDDPLRVDENIIVMGHVVLIGSGETSPIQEDGVGDSSLCDEALHRYRVAVPAVDGENTKRPVAVILPDALDGRPGREALDSSIANEGQEDGLAGKLRKGEPIPVHVLQRELRRHLARHDCSRNRRQTGDEREREHDREKA
jgi:hypothetical protein